MYKTCYQLKIFKNVSAFSMVFEFKQQLQQNLSPPRFSSPKHLMMRHAKIGPHLYIISPSRPFAREPTTGVAMSTSWPRFSVTPILLSWWKQKNCDMIEGWNMATRPDGRRANTDSGRGVRSPGVTGQRRDADAQTSGDGAQHMMPRDAQIPLWIEAWHGDQY